MESFFAHLFITAIGGCFVFFSLREIFRLRRFLASARDAEGTVIDFVDRGRGKDATRNAIVAFTTHSGEQRTFEDPGPAHGMHSGEVVPVKFDPEDPSDARIAGSGRLFGGLVFGVLFGLVWLLGGLFGNPGSGVVAGHGGH